MEMRIEGKYINAYESSQLIQVKNAKPDIKSIRIKTDSLDLSREGLAALRGQVQENFHQIDVDEIMRMREMMPKMSIDLSYDMRTAMQKDIQGSYDVIKKANGGNLPLDAMLTARMGAYERQYEALQKAHADGTRDVYVSDGMDKDGRMQCHKVTLEEDIQYLNEAFEWIADSMTFAAKSHEISQRIKETFGRQKPLDVTLPSGYEHRLSGILRRAASTYAQRREEGNTVSAAQLAVNYLNEDKSFSYAMHKLFSAG